MSCVYIYMYDDVIAVGFCAGLIFVLGMSLGIHVGIRYLKTFRRKKTKVEDPIVPLEDPCNSVIKPKRVHAQLRYPKKLPPHFKMSFPKPTGQGRIVIPVLSAPYTHVSGAKNTPVM